MSIRKSPCVFGVLTVVLFSVAIGRADPGSDARKAIQLLYDRANAAITRRDSVGAFAIYTPGFIAEDWKGKKHSLADIKQQSQLLFSQARTITGSTKILSVTIKGNTALVRITEHSKIVGTDPSTKTDATIVLDSTSDDVWITSNGHWLQSKSKTRSATQTLNGRPFE